MCKCLDCKFLLLSVVLASLIVLQYSANAFEEVVDFHLTPYGVVGGDVFFEITDPPILEYTYRLRPAKDFGSNFITKLEGVGLVIPYPADACDTVKNTKQVKGNVAFIERGDCSFLTKTINVEEAGAAAAIITDFDTRSNEFNYYIEMMHDSTNRQAGIPAGYLLGKNGIIIRSTLIKMRKPFAIINLPVNLTFVPPNRINHPPWLGW